MFLFFIIVFKSLKVQVLKAFKGGSIVFITIFNSTFYLKPSRCFIACISLNPFKFFTIVQFTKNLIFLRFPKLKNVNEEKSLEFKLEKNYHLPLKIKDAFCRTKISSFPKRFLSVIGHKLNNT